MAGADIYRGCERVSEKISATRMKWPFAVRALVNYQWCYCWCPCMNDVPPNLAPFLLAFPPFSGISALHTKRNLLLISHWFSGEWVIARDNWIIHLVCCRIYLNRDQQDHLPSSLLMSIHGIKDSWIICSFHLKTFPIKFLWSLWNIFHLYILGDYWYTS